MPYIHEYTYICPIYICMYIYHRYVYVQIYKHIFIYICIDRPGLTHTRPVSELLSVLLYNRPGFPSTRSVLLLRYSRRTSKCHNRPGFSMSRPVLIYRHYHFFFQQFFRPNSFAMLASPAHSITCSHFANGGISGTGSFSYPSMRKLLTQSGAVNYIFPTPTGSFSNLTGCIHMTKKL